ncbi:hypothetical protein SNE40_019490 [Patella caerulea]|uniref:Pleiotrophin/Midkine C-terminal domain-containing protein n=1 Tax=Patella caerulea TaxID=87958 RepID=A0AAN8J8N8_PATCE
MTAIWLHVWLIVLCYSQVLLGQDISDGTSGSGTKWIQNDCIYQEGGWSECQPGVASAENTLTLKHGGSPCDEFKTITRPCEVQDLDTSTAVEPACQYDRSSSWTACDAATNTKTKVITLTLGDRMTCPITKTLTKTCSKPILHPCTYEKSGVWSECDTATQTQSKVLKLLDGGSHCAASKEKTQPCKCTYLNSGYWTECNPESLTRTKTKILDKNGGAHCPATIDVTKPCKIVCKYHQNPKWSTCNTETGVRTRVLILKRGKGCQSTRTETEPCTAPKECRYYKTRWSRCDRKTGTKTKYQTLKEGHSGCPASKTRTKPCRRRKWGRHGGFKGHRGRHGRHGRHWEF